MKERTVAFLSGIGRGLSEDLKLVKDHLEKESGMKFRYFFRNSTAGKGMQKKAVVTQKKQFSIEEQDYVCIDASLPRTTEGKEEYRRILLLSPYDYIFKTEDVSEKEKGKFKGYTHIICGSPFVALNLKKNYQISDIQLVEDCKLPFAARLESKEHEEAIRERIEFFFPNAKGKKIISFLVMGTLDTEEKEYDFSSFFEKAGEDCFIIINNEVVLNGLDSSYVDRIGFIKGLMQASDILYATDVLCTDSGQLAATFLYSPGKSLFAFSVISNHFSRFMQQQYPGLTVSSEAEMEKLLDSSGKYSKELEELKKEFCYSGDGDACEMVSRILNEDR